MSEENEKFEEPNKVLPEKSRKIYEKCYEKFMEWRAGKKFDSLSENVLLTYFQELSTKFKSSTLWAEYSMLKSTIIMHHQTDISRYYKLLAFLRRESQGFQSKKSKTFLPSEMMTFLNEAPDKKYLSMKIALIFGIMGACRRQELYKLKFDQVKDLESLILVNIMDSKTKIARSFTITGKYYEKCKEYMMLRPNPCTNPSFFLKYINGKCFPHNVGINKFGLMGKTIATYLGLRNPELYTGHCFRRTSATILIDAGGDITSKNRGKWTSPIVAVENAIQTAIPESTSTAYHCIMCLREITKFRYRCLVCPDFEMCGDCERRRGHHDNHYVLRVPMQRSALHNDVVELMPGSTVEVPPSSSQTPRSYSGAEVEQVESTVRRALCSLPIWKQAPNAKLAERDESDPSSRENADSRKKRDNSWQDQSDTDTDSSETENEPNETENQPKETDNESNSLLEVKQEVMEYDEVEVKVEHIKQELDPLEEGAEGNSSRKNTYEVEIESDDVPLSRYSRTVPPSRYSRTVPPAKRRRDDNPGSTNKNSQTAIRNNEESEVILRETTNSGTESNSKEPTPQESLEEFVRFVCQGQESQNNVQQTQVPSLPRIRPKPTYYSISMQPPPLTPIATPVAIIRSAVSGLKQKKIQRRNKND